MIWKQRGIIFFIEICMCFQKITLLRIFGAVFFSPALSVPFQSLTINPIQSLYLQESSSALLFVKEKITANSPTLMNSPEVTCQQMYLRWEIQSLFLKEEHFEASMKFVNMQKGNGFKIKLKILYLPFVCGYSHGSNYKLSELWNNSNWFVG